MDRRKLTDAQVEEIKRKLKAGATHQQLAKEYGVRPLLISHINRGWDYRIPEKITPQPPRVRKGIDPKDTRKLTAEQVRFVRKELMLGTNIKDLAKKLKVSPNTITNIRDKVTYRDVR